MNYPYTYSSTPLYQPAYTPNYQPTTYNPITGQYMPIYQQPTVINPPLYPTYPQYPPTY